MSGVWSWATSSLPRRGVDVNNDGQPDGGIVDGVNDYGLGQYNQHMLIRQGVRANDPSATQLVMLAKGQDPLTQRSVPWLNGIEHEGFPRDSDQRA